MDITMYKHILLADDESGIREPWGDMLVQQGFKVVLAADGDEAFAQFESHEEPFDLLIVDALMPGRDGFKLVQDIRKHSKGRTVPIMMVSGVYRAAQHANRAYSDFGVQVYLDKPITPEKLLSTARKLMGISSKASDSGLRGDKSGASDKYGPLFAMNPQDAPAMGKLSSVPLPVILFKLFRIKATGELSLQNGNERKSILFEKGKIITATSNIAEEYLGETLARVGRITQEQNQASLEISEKTSQRQGDILLKQGWLHSHELPRYLRMQTEERLLRAFMWTDADYAFRPMKALPGQNVVIERNTLTAIKDGIMMNTPVEWLEDEFYRSYGGHYIGYVQGSEPLLKMVFFNRKQLSYLCHGIDYSLTLNQAMESADVPADEATRLLYAWISLGLAKLVPADAKTPKPAPQSFSQGNGGNQQSSSTEATMVQQTSRPQDIHIAPEVVSSLNDEQKEFLDKMLQFYRKVQDKNYFEILGVHEDADDKEIKSNYFKLARMFHPDSLPHREIPIVQQLGDKVFSIITKAHGTISNEKLREEYIKVLSGDSDDATEIAMDILNAEQKFLEAQGEIKRRNWKKTLELINEALRLHSDEGEFVATKVWAQFHIDGGAENSPAMIQAIIDMRRAAEKAPKADQIQFYLGELYKLSGKLVEAYKAFSKAFELNPHHNAARSEIRALQIKLSELNGKKDSKGVLGGLLGKMKK